LDKSPVKVEEWLPISRDVREILANLKAAEERPPNFYERMCRYAHRYLGKLTKDLKLTQGTLRTLSLAKLRVKPEEWWAGFLFSYASSLSDFHFLTRIDLPASDIAMAMACLGLLTFLPELDFSFPALYSPITLPIFFSDLDIFIHFL